MGHIKDTPDEILTCPNKLWRELLRLCAPVEIWLNYPEPDSLKIRLVLRLFVKFVEVHYPHAF